ncbi:MAG: hypothetical protein QW103_02570 [Candidatus Pacearchaeota archaeon]
MFKEKNKGLVFVFSFILILMFSFVVSSINSTNQSNSTNISDISLIENQTTTDNLSVKEQIKCIFKNSNETQNRCPW